ncbi:transmembrane protein with metallophosphoesterase domain-like [Anneissia japonica]|uniref:transmembrane protein with metallophosphoesterase domain-like n=1 Tax=Anneissia japonica TaxID=1529436 RepID=UPI0014255486|nr:transmembrane protein with metallophosphoesterase domain-like [Anneissia japonica]
MSTITRKLIWLFCFLVTVSLLSSLAVRNSHRKIRALVLRAQIVLLIESILSLGSIYIWRNISQVYPAVGAGLIYEVVARETRLTTSGSGQCSSRPSRARPSYIKRRFQTLWKLFLFTIIVSAQLCYPLGVTYVSVEPYTIVLFCYICLGIHILLMTNITLYHLFGYVFQKIFCPETDPVLANFVKVVVIVIVSGFLAFSAVSQAFYGPIIKKVDVPINNLPKSFDGTRIVQVSDIHLGPTVGRSQLQRAIQLINSLNPDLVSITGDLVDSPVEYLSEAALPLTQISPPYGTYFVTGNHEYYTGDVDAWINYLKTLGVKCLHNENIQIHHPNKYEDYFFLAGTDDVQGEQFRYGDHGFKLEEALVGTNQEHPIILLAHRPAAAYTALSADRGINLVLSGHTHGGQFFPMVISVYFANPYFSGLYQYSPSSYVYVSSGTFYWGIPMRLFSTPEVTLVTLHAT